MRLRLGGTFWKTVPKISLQDIFEALVQINQAFSEDQYWLLFRTHLNGFDEIAKRLRRNDVFFTFETKNGDRPF